MREIQSVTVSRETKVSSGNDTAQIIVGLIAIAVIGGIGWLLIGFLIKVIGWLLLVSMAAFGGLFLFKKSNQSDYDQSKPGITAATERFRKHDPECTEDKTFKILITFYLGIFVYFSLGLITVGAYASNPAYQHAPLNYIGFATLVLLAIMLCRVIVAIFQLPKLRTEPAKQPSLTMRVLANATNIALVVYPVCIAAVNVGVL